MSPIDILLGVMLEKWNQRYAFEVDRAAGKAVFTRGDLKVSAEEIEGGKIRVSLTEDGKLFTRVDSPEESAKAIEAIILTEEENLGGAAIRPSFNAWWKFWK